MESLVRTSPPAIERFVLLYTHRMVSERYTTIARVCFGRNCDSVVRGGDETHRTGQSVHVRDLHFAERAGCVVSGAGSRVYVDRCVQAGRRGGNASDDFPAVNGSVSEDVSYSIHPAERDATEIASNRVRPPQSIAIVDRQSRDVYNAPAGPRDPRPLRMSQRITMTAPADAPWYKDGLQFRCTQCGNCCSGFPGFVWVNDDELRAIAEHTGKSIGEIRLMHTRLYAGRLSLSEFANGDCTFFDPKTRGCSIYEARPIQCRTWPFWRSNIESPEAWARASEGCPGIGTGDFVPLEAIERGAAARQI